MMEGKTERRKARNREDGKERKEHESEEGRNEREKGGEKNHKRMNVDIVDGSAASQVSLRCLNHCHVRRVRPASGFVSDSSFSKTGRREIGSKRPRASGNAF